ncbi:MAG: MBOAT family protein [Anaerolineae bacterium]|nr:MBOAT family protein [Anaerolineae bacterium]MBL8106876.1 MBOAT family protein [Anaerolineales bacterium]MCC7188888.1 MBOAT family protein [Anaerolineales bacterium]
MNFNTALFLFLFLPFFLIAYFVAQPRWRPALGILASGLFYAWGSAVNLVFIAALIVANYSLARLFASRFSKWILPLGLLVNVGALAFFKLFTAYQYALFFGLERFFPARLTTLLDSLTFPLGLSFISFQLISYLVDVRKGAVQPEKNFIAFAFYVLMFPKLLVGPIVRYRSVAAQLPNPTIDSDQIANGIRRFLKGFAKKILIADALGVTVDAVFNLPTPALTPAYAWLGLAGYTLQIYFDFSGYTDMAIGLARMMGFRFVENFDLPYLAQSIGDFWRRWHISLSTWFRDYVFFPLERKRIPVIGQSLNILVVFLLTGLWHGVTINFVAWGLLHGFFIALENLFLNRWLQKTFQPVRHLYALTIILFTWLVFRSPSLEYAFQYLRVLGGMVQPPFPLPFHDTSPLPLIEPSFLLALLAGLFLALPFGFHFQKDGRHSFARTLASDILIIALFILSVGMMAANGFTPGIYEGF